MEPAAGTRQVENRLMAAERRLHGELARNVGAEAERGEQFDGLELIRKSDWK